MSADSDKELLLCAWLDGQLPEPEAQAFEARLTNDAELRNRAEGFRQTDALVRNWYGSLANEVAKVGRTPDLFPRRAWQLLRMSGMAAALLLAVGAMLWLWLSGSAEVRAEDVVQRTGLEAAQAPGLLVTFEAVVVTPRDEPDKLGNRNETRSATGEIRFGPLTAHPLLFRCRETWTAADEPKLIRSWGQIVVQGPNEVVSSQWLREEQGRSVIGREVTTAFDPTMPPPGGPLSDERADGSPVDMRTRQAVEGLAALVRGFRNDRFLKWMGYAWQQDGGKGTPQDPWRYRMELGASANAPKGVRTTWLLRLSASGKIIDRIELEETVVDVQTQTQLSSFRTKYKLELRKENWPEGAFSAE